MGKNERQAYLQAIRSWYRRATRAAKGVILNEFCAVCGYHRKYAIKQLNRSGKKHQRGHPGRPATYTPGILLTALKRIWFATDQMCSKKLKAACHCGYRSTTRPTSHSVLISRRNSCP